MKINEFQAESMDLKSMSNIYGGDVTHEVINETTITYPLPTTLEADLRLEIEDIITIEVEKSM